MADPFRELVQDSSGKLVERPSMQQDSHPDHDMPAPEHDGEEHGTNWGNSSWTERAGAIGRAMSGRPGYGPEYK